MAVLSACTPEIQAELAAYAGVNALRAEAGLPPLAPDLGLADAARVRSADMAANYHFGHSPPEGCDYVCLMDRRGIAHAHAGEVIAANTSDWSQTTAVAVQSWATSSPHLAKILDCHYQRFGSGVARAEDGRIYFTMIFEGSAVC